MIKKADESLFVGVEPQLAIKIEYYETVVSQFENPPHIGDGILPGLGDFEGYWGETESGILLSTLKCVDDTDPNPTSFDIYTHNHIEKEKILESLGIPESAVLWKRPNA